MVTASSIARAARNSVLDLAAMSLREVNQLLHDTDSGDFLIRNPRGAHSLACGLDGDMSVTIDGHVGYYCAGMNKRASVVVNGNAGTGLAENMMSGFVHVKGDASQSAGATGCGGLLVIDGNASARCGIALRGLDIVVKGSVGHMSAFMAQAGSMVVLGDTGDALGDSLYEARLFVRGNGKKPRLRLRAEGHARRAQGRFAQAARRRRRQRRRCRGIQTLRFGAQPVPLPRRQCGAVLMSADDHRARTPPRASATFDEYAIAEIHRAASTGIYDIRGFGAKRKLPHFDDLLFLGASISRYPLEGYRERCGTDVTLGARHARKPITLQIPITIAGMSFGSLSANAKEALGRGASLAGTSTTTGDGGMTAEEREHSRTLVYQVLPSRYGMEPDQLRKADAIEIVVGQGAKPGGGGMLLGQKISKRVADMRTLPEGIDQRSPCRHPDWTGPDDLEIKINELREITDWEKPIYVKVGAARPYYDTALAIKAGADVVVLDGMQGGTAATQDVFIEHVGIPTLAAIRPAVQALIDLDMHRKVQLIVSGGIRNGADVAKALALGADAVSIGTAALIALGDNDPRYEDEYRRLGTTAGCYDDWHEGRDPAGITTQDPELVKRLDPVAAGRRLANYLSVLTLEAQTIARACGKSHLHNLEPEDLVALTMESAAMAQVPLAGTNWIPGKTGVLTSALTRARRGARWRRLEPTRRRTA